jgi:hypothetical protein
VSVLLPFSSKTFILILENVMFERKGESDMRLIRYLVATATTAAMALAIIGAGMGPASATTASRAATVEAIPALAASVPSCVHTSLNDSGFVDHLRVTNTCSSYQRFKVVLAFATDFSCSDLPPGYYQDFQWGYPGRFDHLANC